MQSICAVSYSAESAGELYTVLPDMLLALHAACWVLQALQDKVQQLEAACLEARQLQASQSAAHEAAACELRSQVQQQREEVKRVRMEAASLTKQYEQALQRLRREADAGASWAESAASNAGMGVHAL
jgi:hypothetical protein